MTLSVHHIALTAERPDETARLYRDGAGFRPLAVVADVGTDCRWLATPNGFLALQSGKPAGESAHDRQVCDPGITHFCVQSGDGEGLWRRLKEAGIAFNAPPVALGTGAIYAYGRDGEDNVVEVEGIGDVAADVPPWIAHVALVSADLDRLAGFYANLIGRPVHGGGTFANALFENITGLKDVEVSARWIMADNMIFELWRYHNPPTRRAPALGDGEPGYRHIGFSCDDLAATRECLHKLGIECADDESFGELPALAGRDPDGNRFVIIEVPPAHPLSLTRLADPNRVSDRNRALLARVSDQKRYDASRP